MWKPDSTQDIALQTLSLRYLMLAWLAGQHWGNGWCVPHVRVLDAPASTQPEPRAGGCRLG